MDLTSSARFQANKKESLDASYQLYLLNGSDGMVDSIGRIRYNFGAGGYDWGGDVSHDRVRKALHADGSLLVAVDIEFLLHPHDESDAKAISECALRRYEDCEQWATKFSKLHGDEASSDCAIKVGQSCMGRSAS